MIDIIHFLVGLYFDKLCYCALYFLNFFFGTIKLFELISNIIFKIFILLKEIIIFIIFLIVEVALNY